LRYIAGEEPEVLLVQHKCSSPEIDRWMHATLRFPSGAQGVAEFGFRGFYMPRAGVVVTCEKGSIKWDGNRGITLRKNGDRIRESLPAKSTHQLQLEAFAKGIRGEESNAIPPDDAVLTARVLDAMYKKAGLALRGSLRTP
jgi:predicted dehydrogenase